MMALNFLFYTRSKIKGIVIPAHLRQGFGGQAGLPSVASAKDGIQSLSFFQKKVENLDPRFRGDDDFHWG